MINISIKDIVSRELMQYYELDYLEILSDDYNYIGPELQIKEYHNSSFFFMQAHSEPVKEFWADEARWIYKGKKYHGRIRPEVDVSEYNNTTGFFHQWGYSCSLNQEKTVAGLVRMIENSIKDYNNKHFTMYSYSLTSSKQKYAAKILDSHDMAMIKEINVKFKL